MSRIYQIKVNIQQLPRQTEKGKADMAKSKINLFCSKRTKTKQDAVGHIRTTEMMHVSSATCLYENYDNGADKSVSFRLKVRKQI